MRTPEARYLLGAYLRPKRSWVLPLWDDPEAGPPVDLAFDGLEPDELVMIRTIASRTGDRTIKWGWTAIQSLRAGRWPGQGGILQDLGRGLGGALREMLAFLLSGASHTPTERGATREQLAGAGVAEAKVRDRLIDLEVHVIVGARDRRSARARLKLVRAVFEDCAGPFNRLVARRPWRRRAHVRAVAEQQAWPGARFTASVEEAVALTGRPRGDLVGFRGRRVWTRNSPRRGQVPVDTDLFVGQTPHG
ncbi:MAG: hypothetical protein OXG33_15090 [Chloroflexi bacterium]|nr:hypothetical protein [Chloroflexota bacterium]